MELQDLKNDWINNYPKPLIIAGPCSAESETQMLETARRIKESGADVPVFRAGIWKPRTKPNGFEGVGVIGLNWLKKVKEEYGFKTATEVANANHVFAALEADVDILWIGARSTVNPFTVQEIAVALRGTEKTVLVKNPVNPDLALWIGAMERLLGQGITNIGAIHRGFSSYQKTKYRNIPNWQIAIDFKNQFPNIPMIVDPSHICGNRTGLASVAQEALNVGYHGAMIETHCTPDEAWSDAAQQVQNFASGDMLAGTSWQYQANLLATDGAPTDVVLPEEGSTGWSDTWMISSKAAHPNCMYRWMDWIISPEANAMATVWFGEAPVSEAGCEARKCQQNALQSARVAASASAATPSRGSPDAPARTARAGHWGALGNGPGTA